MTTMSCLRCGAELRIHETWTRFRCSACGNIHRRSGHVGKPTPSLTGSATDGNAVQQPSDSTS